MRPRSRSPGRSSRFWLQLPVWTLAAWFVAGFIAAGAFAYASRAGGGDAARGRRAPTAAELKAFAEHMERASAEWIAERHAEAFQELTKAAELNPADSAAHHGLGEVYEKLAMRQAAEICYRRAVGADPGYWPATESLIKVLYDLGEHEKALAAVTTAEARRPNEPYLWAEKALNWIRLGKASDAVPLLLRYNAAKGRQAWGYTQLARAQEEAGQVEAAERTYREAISIDPFFSTAHFWLGQLLIARGSKADAEKSLETYRKLRDLQTQEERLAIALLGKRDNVNALVLLARTRFQLGKRQEALSTLRKALDLAPGDEKLQNLYESVRRQVEEPEQGTR